ncbi:MAG: DUF4906 domain-containing protein [Alistipes sp.]|uniref:DUF4906 domain-containing protein n=1 Tax=Alistipes sp. TaxID=1872444 RepID=UPI0025C14CD8|nr:DUF4906 domain-containing protein [Alistipes sp.]MCD8275883.1 DUF4906 domain-containing protein [Alistipes sp.]
MAVRPNCMESATRSVDENSIRDLNFYLYNNDEEIILHQYRMSASLQFEYIPGDHHVRIIANLGYDLGQNPTWSDFTITHADNYDTLPMAWEGIIRIPSSGGTLPTVEVHRCVAKISYDITISSSDIELESIQLRSIPATVSLFASEETPSENPEDYTDGHSTPLSGHQAAGTFYMLPNPQEENLSITDQRDKNAVNAPTYASYMLIRTTKGDKVQTYSVYLGKNNTSDFNIQANTHYRFKITILGDNEIDSRVTTYSVTVSDDFDSTRIGDYCTCQGVNHLRLHVESTNADPKLTGQIELLAGDGADFHFDETTGTLHTFAIENCNGDNGYTMAYTPKLFTSDNHRLHYRLTLTDAYGFTQTYDSEYRFANLLTVSCEKAFGTITSDGALQTYISENGPSRNIMLLTHQDGCRLTAEPAAGYVFDGWYADIGYTQCISRTMNYDYCPKEPLMTLYARFLPETPPLTIELTAPATMIIDRTDSFTLTIGQSGNHAITVFTSSDPQMIFTLPDGRIISNGEEVTLADKTYQVSITPHTTEDLTIKVHAEDGNGRNAEQEITIPVRYPIFNARLRTQAASYSECPMELTITSQEYEGAYTVSYTSSGQDCSVAYNGMLLLPDVPVTLKAGSHTFTATSYSAGRAQIVFTVTDSYGQSRTARGSLTWK